MAHAGDPFRTLYDANHERVRRLLARIVGPQESRGSDPDGIRESGQSIAAFPWRRGNVDVALPDRSKCCLRLAPRADGTRSQADDPVSRCVGQRYGHRPGAS